MNMQEIPQDLQVDNPPSRDRLLEYAAQFEDFKLPFLPLFVDDFVADTMDLTSEEVGAYFIILMALWRRDCKALPEKNLHRLCRCTKHRFKTHIWAEIGRFFQVADGVVWNRRLEQEWRKTATFSLKKRMAGKQGGTRKSLKLLQGGASTATSSAVASHPHICNTSNDVLHKGQLTPKKRRSQSTALPEDFVPDLDKAQSLMAELELNRSEMNYCWQQMKDHAYANDRRQVDWNRAFNSWVRKSVQYAEVGPNTKSRRTAGTSETAFNF